MFATEFSSGIWEIYCNHGYDFYKDVQYFDIDRKSNILWENQNVAEKRCKCRRYKCC